MQAMAAIANGNRMQYRNGETVRMMKRGDLYDNTYYYIGKKLKRKKKIQDVARDKIPF